MMKTEFIFKSIDTGKMIFKSGDGWKNETVVKKRPIRDFEVFERIMISGYRGRKKWSIRKDEKLDFSCQFKGNLSIDNSIGMTDEMIERETQRILSYYK